MAQEKRGRRDGGPHAGPGGPCLRHERGFPFSEQGVRGSDQLLVHRGTFAPGVEGVEPRGISDLAIGEKKILGTSIYRTRLVLFYQASLLVSNDLSIFSRYLAMPARVPEYRAGRAHEDFCTTLVREGYSLSVSDVMKVLKEVVDVRLPALR